MSVKHKILKPLSSNLDREIQRSEILRARLLAVLALAISLFLLARLLFGALAQGFETVLTISLFFSLGVYELIFSLGMSHLQKRELKLPWFGRFANGNFEVLFCFVVSYFVISDKTPSNVFDFPLLYLPFVFIVLSVLRMDAVLSVTVGLVTAMSWFVYVNIQVPTMENQSSLSFLYERTFFYALSGFAAGLISRQLRKNLEKALQNAEDKSKILHIFGQHVSPAVVDKLLTQDLDAKGEYRTVCVMFLDIRSFTAFSEKKQPEEVVDFLNNLFDFMIEIVNKNQGIVNKFLGDGFMAIFGAPIGDHAASENAIRAAKEINHELQVKIGEGKIPSIKIGIGLHTGLAMTGQVGSKTRKEYTIIGDTVNLASRLESLNKELGTTLVVSEDTKKEAPSQGADLKDFGEQTIRGKDLKIKVFGI